MSYLIEDTSSGDFTKVEDLDEIVKEPRLAQALIDGELVAWQEAGRVTIQLEVG